MQLKLKIQTIRLNVQVVLLVYGLKLVIKIVLNVHQVCIKVNLHKRRALNAKQVDGVI